MKFVPFSALFTVTFMSVIGLFSDLVQAQTREQDIIDSLPKDIVQIIERRPDQAMRSLLAFAFSASDDGVVTPEGFENAKLIKRATERTSHLFLLLAMDLNADGTVSREEFNRVSRVRNNQSRADMELNWLEANTDGDNSLSISEIMKFGDRKTLERLQSPGTMAPLTNEILKMDIDGDGQVTTQEIKKIVDAISD